MISVASNSNARLLYSCGSDCCGDGGDGSVSCDSCVDEALELNAFGEQFFV